MSYCYGFEKECVVDDASNATTIQSIITACSDQTPLLRFDPGQVILDAIGTAGIEPNVGWPSYLSDGFNALAPTSRAMCIFFIMGTCAVGLSIILRLATIRYIWQPRGAVNPATGLESPPSYPGYPESPPSDVPPSKIQLFISMVRAMQLMLPGRVVC